MAKCRQAHWRHLANMTEVVLRWAHPNPQPKLQIDQFSHFCTAYSRKVSIFYNRFPFCQSCPFQWGGSGPPSNTIPWAHPSPQPKWHVDRFSFCTDNRTVSLYFTMGCTFPQNCLFLSGHLDHLIHGSLGLPESSTQMASP